MAYIYIPWLLFSQILLQVAKHEAKVPALIVFGDSTVDSGNNNRIKTLLKSNFKPYGRDFAGGQPTGRFSNGRVPPDFISEAFGLKPFVPAYLDPNYGISDFVTGVCFASAGTGYDNATSDVLELWVRLGTLGSWSVRPAGVVRRCGAVERWLWRWRKGQFPDRFLPRWFHGCLGIGLQLSNRFNLWWRGNVLRCGMTLRWWNRWKPVRVRLWWLLGLRCFGFVRMVVAEDSRVGSWS